MIAPHSGFRRPSKVREFDMFDLEVFQELKTIVVT